MENYDVKEAEIFLPKRMCFQESERLVYEQNICLDNWTAVAPLETREGCWDEPIKNRTRYGWVICGSHLSDAKNDQHRLNIDQCDSLPIENLH